MCISTDVLTLRYVAARSGFVPAERPEGKNFGRIQSWKPTALYNERGFIDEDRLLSAVAVMLEASRHLRRGYSISVDVYNPVATVCLHRPGG
jgi:hypothetical protein